LAGAATRPRTADRLLALDLHRRDVPLEIVEIALRLAVARRTARPPHLPPLPPVRSLHYFLPLIEQLPASPPPDGYLDYLRRLVPDRESVDATVSRTPSRSPRRHPAPQHTGARLKNDTSS
jgi:hypothetical protein